MCFMFGPPSLSKTRVGHGLRTRVVLIDCNSAALSYVLTVFAPTCSAETDSRRTPSLGTVSAELSSASSMYSSSSESVFSSSDSTRLNNCCESVRRRLHRDMVYHLRLPAIDRY